MGGVSTQRGGARSAAAQPADPPACARARPPQTASAKAEEASKAAEAKLDVEDLEAGACWACCLPCWACCLLGGWRGGGAGGAALQPSPPRASLSSTRPHTSCARRPAPRAPTEASPEEMMLSYVSGEKSKDRTDRELVTPWFKFLWETYRCGRERGAVWGCFGGRGGAGGVVDSAGVHA